MFRAHVPLQGPCDNLMFALNLWANLQVGTDNPVDTIFERLHEQSRLKVTNEPRTLIEVDNQKAVKIGDLEKNSEVM